MITADSPLWRQLRHPLVRDLAWCLLSPELMAAGTGCETLPTGDQTATEAALRRLDLNPQPLEQWAEQCRSRRLGLIFEHLWQFWWRHYDAGGGEWLFNLQLHGDGRTLGEADALCWQRTDNQLLHAELAVKFYLGVDADRDAATAAGWYGPEVKDRLDLKWHHLMERQLAPERLCNATLPNHWHYQTLRSALLSRGRLFYPLCDRGFDAPDRHLLAAAHERGYWLHSRDLETLPAGLWLLPQRRQWLAPLRHSASHCLSTTQAIAALRQQLNSSPRPLQLAMMQQENNECFEAQRLFVVPDQWPLISGAEFRRPLH